MLALVLVTLLPLALGAEPDKLFIGPRPLYLVDKMKPSPLKSKLESCKDMEFRRTKLTIGHRGAPLQFPEHTRDAYMAAYRMGAGIIECDVTFTKDLHLVCRHSQCDLAVTTNILLTPLASKCTTPFTPATDTTPASAKCCTSDITLAEYKSLCGKNDGSNTKAKTPDQWVHGTASFRSELYESCNEVLSHKESIELFSKLGVGFTPELKTALVDMPYGETSYSQADFATQLVQDYIDAGIDPSLVYAQSFNLPDVFFWIEHFPKFGEQAVLLLNTPTYVVDVEHLRNLKSRGINIISPPLFPLMKLDESNKIVASDYALAVKEAGIKLITYTIERSGRLYEDMLHGEGGHFYFDGVLPAIKDDGDVYKIIDVLARDVGCIGIFTDHSETVTYYANCMGMVF
eukprot:Filipodium_phascolosomae@DN7858_c0_g1_i1.p1